MWLNCSKGLFLKGLIKLHSERGKSVKIISGFCSGADIGGSKAAKDMGFPVGGWIWHGWLAGHPEWEEYGVMEVPQGKNRTEYNALLSDATLHFKHNGENVTHYSLTQEGRGFKFQRPYFEVTVRDYDHEISDHVVEQFQKWLDYEEPQVLNIAGNADDRMEAVVYDFMIRALTDRSPAATLSEAASQ